MGILVFTEIPGLLAKYERELKSLSAGSANAK
jgi:hypothetical protein